MDTKRQCIVIGIIFLLIVIVFSGCTSHNKDERGWIRYLSYSSDGTKLISVTYYNEVYYNNTIYAGCSDFQIWNTSSGENIWSEFPSYKEIALFSPDGKYFIISNTTIYDITGEIKTQLDSNGTDFIDWSSNGNFILTYKYLYDEPCLLKIWDGKNFSLKYSFALVNQKYLESITISPDGTKIAYINKDPFESLNHVISVIDIAGGTFTNLWNKSIIIENRKSFDIQRNTLTWSLNNDTIGVICSSNTNNKLFIWNASDGQLLYNISIDSNPNFSALLSPYCDSYMLEDLMYKNNLAHYNISLKIFDLNGLKNIISPSIENIYTFDWSYKGNTISVGGEDGIISLLNASTGNEIMLLKTPIRSVVQPIPSISLGEFLLVVFIVTIILVFFERKK
jgi:uncharacterized protein with WD repeat